MWAGSSDAIVQGEWRHRWVGGWQLAGGCPVLRSLQPAPSPLLAVTLVNHRVTVPRFVGAGITPVAPLALQRLASMLLEVGAAVAANTRLQSPWIVQG